MTTNGGCTRKPGSHRSSGGWPAAGYPGCPTPSRRWICCCSPWPPPRKVHRDGIRCHGLRYLALTLAAYVGEEVTIRYDPRDLAEIRVFHQGSFLCIAVSPELAAASISLKDLEAARNRRRRQLRQELSSRRSVLDKLTDPVRESVPTDAATIERTPNLAPADPPRPSATRLKIYRED